MSKSRKGFTLIELLIVVVIIGILASIAIPKFGNTKNSAIFATMKSDLRSLATTQETYFAQFNGYMPTGVPATTLYQPSSGITVTIGGPINGGNWSATAVSAALGTKTCTISVGGTGTQDNGAPYCDAP